ncbi:MAG TPA: SGNH/GDSL hydrolase family protein [Vicinamibacterales bacterium]|nr:SGNH/GDSL hydrolase family protein [Vicinamibacterales bacterium]
MAEAGRGSSPARNGRRLAGLFFCALAIVAVPAAAPAEPLRVLFIGNSLTASNDLPNMFASLAHIGGHERPVTRTIAIGGFSLEDHWNQGDAQKAIAQAPWDFVVLQQGPSALVESRRLLVEYTRRFAEIARAAGATPALYMVWPSANRRSDFPGVSTSYGAAARAVKGRLLPAGDVWRTVLREHQDIALYSDDGLHPTLAGSYLAALVIYRELYQASVTSLPPLGLLENDARRLKSAVR